MTKINRSLLVDYSPDQMYDLVNDFEQYPEFLPWCQRASLKPISDKTVEGTLYFSHGPITKSFTTLNTLTPNQSIHMQLIDGPFRQFEGAWTFKPVTTPEGEAGCEVSLELEFEFSSPLIAMAAGPVFQTAISSMIEAFAKRAQAVYV